MVIDFDNITKYIERVRPWPWRVMVMVLVVSFLVASIVSALIGWYFMGQTGKFSIASDVPSQTLSVQPPADISKVAVTKILERNIFNSEIC